MDGTFGSVFLPSVIHCLTPVVADVNSRHVDLLQMLDRMAGGNIMLRC